MSPKAWAIGIDLGTSHSAVCVCPLTPDGALTSLLLNLPPLETLEIAQVGAPNRTDRLQLLPSALYIPLPEEQERGVFPQVWFSKPEPLVAGAFAREQGSRMPERVILSVKSWLCNPHIDRRAAVLPWGEAASSLKFSPVDASAHLLRHLSAALGDYLTDHGSSLAAQTVVITVPASFDEVARTLTIEAAAAAGITNPILLEEPQAAFYSWLHEQGESWTEQIAPGDMILVCDVGGGTTDFSLIAAVEREKSLELQRVSIGDHILLGGDNMDLALAYRATNELESQGIGVDQWQFNALVFLLRGAKERLLLDDAPESIMVTLPSRGSNLFAVPVTYTLTRDATREMILEGFFPLVEANVTPISSRRSGLHESGLREAGLPYAADSAITKHLAQFLAATTRKIRGDEQLSPYLHEGKLVPRAILFNGGVFHARVVRDRMRAVLEHWNPGEAILELTGTDKNHAVAAGAAVFAYSHGTGEGFRIRSRTARSYYLGVESSMPAVPGFSPPVKGVCVIPQGLDEGTSLQLANTQFHLRTGQEVEFRLFTSVTRAEDQVGTMIRDAEKELVETSRLVLHIPQQGNEELDEVPVSLEVCFSEIGVLELWMVAAQSTNEASARWKLEFNTREVR